MNKPSICLNMIVKNEEHIIIETLNNLCSYITFDYWVISDTGSTDTTKSLITTFFAEKQIPGELVDHEWKDFGYNRSKALESAYNKTDYLLIFDADDKIIGDFKLPGVFANATSGTPIVDSYQLKFELHFTYTRPLIINNRKKWCFKGVLHETLSALETMVGEEILEGDYYLDSGKSGNRSKNPNKYLDDAIVLKNAFEKELTTDYGMACRYAFYCAQSYKDYGHSHRDESIKWYKKVLDLHNWSQEKYYACCMIGDMYKEMDDNENAVKYWVKSAEYDDERIEGIVDAMEYYRNSGQNILTNALYHKFKNYSKNVGGDKLFVTQSKYNDELEYNNSISAYYVNDHRSGYDCCKKILINQLLSTSLLQMTLSNILFYKDILESELAEDCIDLFYAVDNLICDTYNINESCSASEFELWELLFAKTRTILTKSSSLVLKNKPSPKIFISFTTCKRVDLFSETVNSILNHWTDVDKIDYWFCVDDNSSVYDRVQMKRKYNWFEYYMKTPEEKGHRHSMNIIWNKLVELKPTYWIHMEDDFLFHKKMDYVSEAINGLTNGEPENVKQILFNRNYSETIEDYNIKGHVVTENVDTVIHHHKIGDFPYTNCHYWPHYSFRPSMIDVDTILKLGNFDSSNQFFEMDYANKWSNSGYKSGFFNRITNRHIGRLTSERNDKKVKNAYELNGEEQFQNQPLISDQCKVYLINLDRRKDRLNYMEQYLKMPYERFAAIDGNNIYAYTEFTNFLTTIDNTHVVLGEIGCKLSHYTLWSKINQDTLILEDDVIFTQNSISSFKNAYNNLKNVNIEWDIIYVGGQWTPDYGINSDCYMNVHKITDSNLETMFIHVYDNFYLRKNNNNDTFNSPLFRTPAAYIISERGAKKLLNIIQQNMKEFMEQPADMWLLQIEKDNKIITLDYFSHPFYQGGFDLVKEECLLQSDIHRGNLTLINIRSNLESSTRLNSVVPVGSRMSSPFSTIDGSITERNAILKTLTEHFVFVNGLDQNGCDIYYKPNNDLCKLLQLALNDKTCNAVNSLGFYKNNIQNLTTSNYFKPTDGIYIKKEYYHTNVVGPIVQKDVDKRLERAGFPQEEGVGELPAVINSVVPEGIRRSHNKKRIKMIGNFWDSSKELIDEFNLMIPAKNYIYNDFEITDTDDNIDYYVIINQPPNEETYYDPAITLVFQMEPEAKNSNYGTHTWGKWYKPDKDKFRYVNDLSEHLNVVQWRLNIPYDILSNAIENKTNNRISSIVSYKNYFDGHIKRIEFIKYIENHNLIDVFGKDNYHNFNSYIGKLTDDEPSSVLIHYKYYFMPENNAEDNYATEKIWEPILCECLCFYWGCPNLEDYIDSRAFVRLPLDNFEESLAIVKKAIEEDWWSHRIEFIRQAKRKILNELAFFPTLEKIINANDNPRVMERQIVPGIIAVFSCHKYKDTRLQKMKTEILTKKEYSGWKVIYILGNPFLENDYEINDDVITIKCEDSYIHLMKKVIFTFDVLLTIYDIQEGILRCGDDILVDTNKLESFLASSKCDYMGFNNPYANPNRDTVKSKIDNWMPNYYNNHPEDFADPMHNIKYTLAEINTFNVLPTVLTNVGVVVYFSVKSCIILIEDMKKNNWDVFFYDTEYGYRYTIEDVGIAAALYINNIQPTLYMMYTENVDDLYLLDEPFAFHENI